MAFVKNVLINGKTVATYANKKGEILYQRKETLFDGMSRTKSVLCNPNGVPKRCQGILRHNGVSSVDVYVPAKDGNTVLRSNNQKPIEISTAFLEFASRFLK